MSAFLCGLNAFAKKLEGDDQWFSKLKQKDKDIIANRLDKISYDWDKGKYKNVKDANWNNFETFEWLWKKYTHLPALDPSEFPINYRHIRKFELGLKYYDSLVSKPKGIFASKFHLPRATMRNIPELAKFEKRLVDETSFYRDFSTNANKNINEFLQNMKVLSLSLGEESLIGKSFKSGGQKKLARLQKEYDALSDQWLSTENLKTKTSVAAKLRANQLEIQKFYKDGSGKAFELMNDVLQGADIATIPNLKPKQRIALEKMKSNYIQIRKSTSVSLVRGLQKIKSMAKDKENLKWVDGTIDKVSALIKSIEFQKNIDENNRTIDYKDMQSNRDFIGMGFDVKDISTNKKVAFSPHYMSHYTLGMIKTLQKIETSIDRGDMSLDVKIKNELDSWDGIVNVAKPRTALMNNIYNNDPYFFLKKYASDVGIFNYRLHVKDNFNNAANKIIDEHLNPAREAGRKDLEEASMDMLQLMEDVYNDVYTIDPRRDSTVENIMRTMQAVTYFRLMGGNIRSAARNGTQRAYEWVHFGFKAAAPFVGDSARFYKNVGGAESNQVKVNRQKVKYGLQWFNGKNMTSNAFDSLKGENVKISEASRGALEDSYMNNNEMFVDEKGNLQVKHGDSYPAFTARVSSNIAKSAGGMHRVVEDWNRGRTFDVGFALAHGNLEQTSSTWRAQQILKRYESDIKSKKGDDYIITEKDLVERYGKDADKVMSNWIENKAGELAYSGVLDLHFEYAKWNKAKAIRVTGKESKATMMAKMGLGQFAHYRFSMTDLMYKWGKEAGLSARAGDFTSEEFMRPMRFGMLQALIWGATIAGKVNLPKLMPNDVLETGETLLLHAEIQAMLHSGKITEEQIQTIIDDKSRKAHLKMEHGDIIKKYVRQTFGQKGKYFLGPNAPMIMSAYELVAKANLDGNVDPRTEEAFDTAFKHMTGDRREELYSKLNIINAQLARTVAYTIPSFLQGSSFTDLAFLELGLFPDKDQRNMSKIARGKIPKPIKKFFGVKDKKRKKRDKFKGLDEFERQAAMEAMSSLIT